MSAHKISKSFGLRPLFENLSLGIEEKERVGLLGPNGAGKSTLLNILAGRIDPDEGQVSRRKNLRVGFLEQDPQFPAGVTILQALLENCEDREDSLPRALELMARLDLNRFGGEALVSELSGGWRKRVALARELTPNPGLLLLDEPTNHLDLSSILWLEEFLRAAPFAVLMITHDRLFLQRVAARILDLDPRNPNFLLNVQGDYAAYLETKELELAALQRHESVAKNRLRRETEWLRRGSLARQTKQSARIEAAADLKDSVRELRVKNQDRRLDLSFGEADHSPRKLIEAQGLTKKFGDRVLFENLDLLLTPKTRLGLLGDNGCGKSTLIKVLLGEEPPTSGKIKRADRLDVAYFEQGRETLLPELSVRKNICAEGEYVFFRGQHLHVQSYLDRFDFAGAKGDTQVRKLSGGEQARLRLAQLMLKSSQVLVLDEPTNDLDSGMLENLENSLADFDGAVVLVSHDRYFMDAVCDQILAFPPSGSANRQPQKFSSYFQWEPWYKSESEIAEAKIARPSAAAPAKKTRLSYKEKFELENMEAGLLKLEAELSELQRESESPATLADHKKLTEIHTRMGTLHQEIEARYARWNELESKSKN